MISPRHQLQRKRHKRVHGYSHKSIVDFKLVVVNTPPKLPDKEKRSITTSFFDYFQYQSIEKNTKRILTHILKRFNGKKIKCSPKFILIDTCWTCINGGIFHLTLILLITFPDIFKTRFTLCCNVSGTCLLSPYNVHIDNEFSCHQIISMSISIYIW